jgi:hypothetical protein
MIFLLQVRLRYLHVNGSEDHGLPSPIRPGGSSPSDRMEEAEIVLVPMDKSSHDGQVILRQVVKLITSLSNIKKKLFFLLKIQGFHRKICK